MYFYTFLTQLLPLLLPLPTPILPLTSPLHSPHSQSHPSSHLKCVDKVAFHQNVALLQSLLLPSFEGYEAIELHRVLVQGLNAAVHLQDLPLVCLHRSYVPGEEQSRRGAEQERSRAEQERRGTLKMYAVCMQWNLGWLPLSLCLWSSV